MELILEEESEPQSSPMLDYFCGKVVLLTGGTGFLGILYVQKLLRIGVKMLYLIIRSKKGKCPQERISELFSGVLYQKLQTIDPNYLQRIRVVEGDMNQEKFGISPMDLADIHDNAQIFIHAAANVRFDDDLGSLVRNNLKGTKEVLKICKEIRNLEVFTYISTAYSHCNRKDIDEKFYETPIDPDVMICLVDKYGDTDQLKILQDRIVQPWPNNYTYSKALCEELVRRWTIDTRTPTCIIRPSIIISTAEDPVIGWTNNSYGLNGVSIAVGVGALRLLRVDRNSVGDLVCADFVINSTLAAIWVTNEDQVKKTNVVRTENGQDPKIYHVSSTKDSPVTWGDVVDLLGDAFKEYPAKRMIWKHCLHTSMCPVIIRIFTFYYHVIPAYFFDFYLKMTASKLRLLPIKRKAQRFMVILEYFMSREWDFTNDNMRSVISRMNGADQRLFPCDIRRWKWSEYCHDYMHGIKLYMMNETLNDAIEGRRKLKKLVFMHYVFLIFYYSFHFSIYYSILNYYGFFESVENTIRNTYNFIRNPV